MMCKECGRPRKGRALYCPWCGDLSTVDIRELLSSKLLKIEQDNDFVPKSVLLPSSLFTALKQSIKPENYICPPDEVTMVVFSGITFKELK
jgi:hypothetical protein